MISDLLQIDEKIASVDAWHLSLPVTSRRDHGIGTVADNMEVVIVRLTSESGAVGFGEASPWAVFTGTPEASYAAIDRYFRPILVGTRLGDFFPLIGKIEKAVVHCTEAKAAIEAAIFDLAGKLLERPAWAFLGKQCRTETPLSVSLANPDFEEDLKLVERLEEDKIGIVKLKTGFKDDEFDIMRLEKLRIDHTGLKVRVDYNQGLSGKEAVQSILKLDEYVPDFIEQPVPSWDYDTMSEIRNSIRSQLLADESIFSPHDMHRAVREKICDGVSIKIMKSGGMMRGIEISQIAKDADLFAYGGDMFETGLAHLAGMHMIAVAQNITLGCEFYHANYYLVEDLLVEPFPVKNGMAQVPEAPGLGIDVNMDVIEKYTVRHSLS